EKQTWEKTEKAVVARVMTNRLVELKQLLEVLIALFSEKVGGIKVAVEAFERSDTGHHARIILEVMCLSKLVRSGEAVFSHKLTLLSEDPGNSLVASDATQRALYLLACKWINCMLKLRKLIKKHLSTEATPPISTSGSFTLGGITFHPTAVLSPIPSPRVIEESTLTPSAIAREPGWGDGFGIEPLARRRSSGALSTMNELDSPGSSLPAALIAGHPSLPHRSKGRVVLVNEAEPITCVAYALATDSYEEELDGWKLRIHREAVESVASHKHQLGGSEPMSTNWSRAAMETPLSVPFKYHALEMPLHLSLLSGKSSSSLSSSCWELSTVVYYPLQVRGLLLLL
ncbi:hypothetical protein BBJ28_00005259, partial [Nothophytophthora sp. Chile5]